jgi:hypothetical protein
MNSKSIYQSALGSHELAAWQNVEAQIEADNKRNLESKLVRKSINYLATIKNPAEREAMDLLRALYLEEDGPDTKIQGAEEEKVDHDPRAEKLKKMILRNMLVAVRADKKLKNKLAFSKIMLDKERKLILHKYPRVLNLRGEPTNSLVQEIQEIEQQRRELKNMNPDAYFALHALEYRNHIREVQKGNLVQTAHVQICKERMLANMNEGQATFIHGHLGAVRLSWPLSPPGNI